MDQELLIYEAFPYDQQQPQNNLKVRFKKVRAERLFKQQAEACVKDAGLQSTILVLPRCPIT